MKQLIKMSVFFLMAGTLFASCKKSPIDLQQKAIYGPLAHAGDDQIIILPGNSIILKGSGTDADGKIERYHWTNIGGPSSFTIVNPNMAETEINNLVHGVYLFELEVTDNDKHLGRDKTRVFVLDSLTDPINVECNGCWDY